MVQLFEFPKEKNKFGPILYYFLIKKVVDKWILDLIWKVEQ